MSQDKNNFRHESLQDAKTIREILQSLTKGLANGKLTFSDEDGEIILQPEGLLHLKLTAASENNRQKLNLRISWQVQEEKKSQKKNLSVSGK